MNAVAPPPPVSRWGMAWRIGLSVLISALAWFEVGRWQWENARWWFWLDLAIGVVSFAACRWRRRYPFAVAMGTNVASVVSMTSGGPATWALFSMATRRRWVEILPVGVTTAAAALVFAAIDPAEVQDGFLVTAPIVLTIVAVTIGWGMFIGSRRELLATLRERAETSEAEQAARVAQARVAERNRIAREMHDVLAHRISMVTMHAGVLTYRDDLTPEQVRTSAEIIQTSSHQALVELREVLGVLREGPGDAGPERPQPAADDVTALVDEARAAGTRLVAVLDIDLSAVPTAIGRTLYRAVQEALTNARKHAPDTRVVLHLRGAAGTGIHLDVSNPYPIGSGGESLPSSGLGLVGLSERIALAGGTIHRREGEQDFGLRVWLPWPA